MPDNVPSPFLALPRELRDEILGYLTLPGYVYTSSTTKDTRDLYLSRRSSGETYVDTRIYLPCRPSPHVMATCRQLRDEGFELHARLLNSSLPAVPITSPEKPLSNILAERLGSENAEESERACHDSTLRITLEIKRGLRGVHGYYTPKRDELSPRFLALLPLMTNARKVRIAIWPGFDWWNGGPQQFIDKRGNVRSNADQVSKPNAACVAIGKILPYFPQLQELHVDVLMQAEQGASWDLPDRKWENIQPWLDSPVVVNAGQALQKVTRRLVGFWKPSEPEPFYTQHEHRQTSSSNVWAVDRKGDMGTPTMRSFCDPDDQDMIEYFRALAIDESFMRTD